MKLVTNTIFSNALNTAFRRIPSVSVVLSAMMLVGCFSGDGSNDVSDATLESGETETSETIETIETSESLSMTSNNVVVLGGSMEVKVALNGTVSIDSISSVGELSLPDNSYRAILSFSKITDADKFEVSYSDTCYAINTFDICSISIIPKSNAYELKNQQVNYTVTATGSTKTLTTSEDHFTIKALTLSLDDETGVGSGGSGMLTVLNGTELAVDLTGAYFVFQESNALLSLSNSACTGVLQGGGSCQVLVTADNSAESATATVNLVNAGGEKLGAVDIPIHRPVMEVLLDQEATLEANHELEMTVYNSASFPVRGVSVAFSGEQVFDINMTENTCPATLAEHESCTVTFRSEDKPSGSGVLTVTADNADAVTQSISGSTPMLISAVLSPMHISTNSHANKEVVMTVTNVSSASTLNNLLLSSSLLGSGLTMMESQSSCVNLYGNMLPAGESCQYIMTYIPEEVTTASLLDELIYLSSDESATTVDMLTINKYPSFYSLPQNTKRQQLGLAGYSVKGVFANGDMLYVATSNGLSISTGGADIWVNKTSADGLGSNYINDVVVSGEVVYVATSGGLSISFDGGNNWINKRQKDGLGGNIVKRVLVSNSHIYAATGNGLSISNDGGNSWISKSVSEGLGGRFVYDVVLSGSTLYAATNGGVSISNDGGDAWVNRTTSNGLSSDTVLALAVSGDKIYAATNKGLSVSSNHGETWQSVSNEFDGVSIRSVKVVDGVIYVGADSGLAISKDNGESWSNIPLNGERIHQIVVSGNAIYVGTEDGLYISSDQGESWEVSSVLNSYLTSSESAYTNAMSVAEGVIYLATNGGLSISNDGGKTWVNKNQDDGLLSAVVNDVYAVGSKVYIATDQGLSISSDGGNTWVSKTTENGLADNNVKVVYVSNDVIYAGTVNGLSTSSDNGDSWVNKTTENGLIGNDITGISIPVNVYGEVAAIYIGTSSGLSISTDGGESWVNKTTSDGLLDNNIINLYATDSIIAVGTVKGLSFSYDFGENWEEVTTKEGLGGDLVTGIYISDYKKSHDVGGKEIYVATDKGLSMSFDGGQTWAGYTVGNGLASNTLTGVFVAGANIFVTTTNGLSAMTRVALEWEEVLNDFQLGFQQSGYYSQGKIYVATLNGLYISEDNAYSWHHITKDNGLPNNRLISVYANGDVIYVGSFSAGLFISHDGGISWERKTTADGLGSNRVYNVYATGDTVYVVTPVGLYRSMDGGQSWVIVIDDTFGPASTVTHREQALYVTSQYKLFISIDGGESWESKVTESQNWITAFSVFDGSWYLESDLGGFLSQDNGDTWESYSSEVFNGEVLALGNMVYRLGGGVALDQLTVSEDQGNSWYNARASLVYGTKIGLSVSGSTVYLYTVFSVAASRDLLN